MSNNVIRDFFTLNKSEVFVVHEEINHMLTEINSGWTFRDLYCMPVSMRKWYHAKYNERIQRMNDDNDGE